MEDTVIQGWQYEERIDELEAELAALKAENEQLRADIDYSSIEAAAQREERLTARIAELEAAVDRLTKRTYERTKVLWSDTLLESFSMRDPNCNLVTLELGEPDEDGFYMPILTSHYDDNPLKQTEAELEALKASTVSLEVRDHDRH